MIHNAQSGVAATKRTLNQADLAEQIREGWTETLERIVQTGNRLIEGGFRKAGYEGYRLPFSYSYSCKLMKIARCPRITDPANRAVLPDKVDALHQITMLSDRLFNQGVAEGVITSHCLVIDIKQFRQSFVEPRGRGKRRRVTVVYECSPPREESAVEGLDSFVAAVQQLATDFPAITVRRPEKMKELF